VYSLHERKTRERSNNEEDRILICSVVVDKEDRILICTMVVDKCDSKSI
jgi:hypothetical protein